MRACVCYDALERLYSLYDKRIHVCVCVCVCVYACVCVHACTLKVLEKRYYSEILRQSSGVFFCFFFVFFNF